MINKVLLLTLVDVDVISSFNMPMFAVPGGKPVIGPVLSMPNLFIAAGHEGEGLSMVIYP